MAERAWMAFTVAGIFLSAAVVGGATAILVLEWRGAEPPPAKHEGAPVNRSQAEWAFVVRAVERSPTAPRLGGTVFAFLTRLQGDANVSADRAVPVEIAAVTWNARDLTPVNGTILAALNQKLNADPPIVIARGAVSKNGDAVELTIPTNASVRSVVVHAPQSGDFLALGWPGAKTYRWNGTGWGEITAIAPALLARTAGT